MEKIANEKYTIKWTHKLDSDKMDTFEFKADKTFNLSEILDADDFDGEMSSVIMNVSKTGTNKTYEFIGDGTRADVTLFEDGVTLLLGRSLITVNLETDEIEGKARLGGLKSGGHVCGGCGGCGGKR